MPRAIGPFLTGMLAALAAGWGWLVVVGGATFAIGPTRLPLAYVLTPLLGLALFQLVFGLLTGRWRGWRFWAIVAPFSAAVWGLDVVSAISAQLSPLPALLAVLAAHLTFGLWALSRTEPAQ